MKLKIIPIVTWNPTKISAYDECPRRTQLRYAQHLCPLCFRGKVGYDEPCDRCGKLPVKPEPMARGIRIENAITAHVHRTNGPPEEEMKFHPDVKRTIAGVVQSFRRLGGLRVSLKHQISLGPDWRPLPRYTKGPWFWGELDVLMTFGKLARVLDWKTGGINKKTGEVRPHPKYDDQLEIYGVAVLSAQSEVMRVEPELVFLDAKSDPIVGCGFIHRKDLGKLQKKWEGKIKPMFSDTIFSPRPGIYCDWCDYSKRRGGPCEF